MVADFQIKYRPRNFKQVFGQPEACSVLQAHLTAGTLPHVTLFGGPPGCLRGDTLIYDPIQGRALSVRERCREGRSFSVFASTMDRRVVIADAMPPVAYPKTRMYLVETSEQSFFVTSGHRFLSYTGEFLSLKELLENGFSEVRLASTSGISQQGQLLGESRCRERRLSSLVGYPTVPRFYDERPLLDQENVQGLSQRQVGVPAHIRHCFHKDEVVGGLAHNQTCQRLFPQAMMGFGLRSQNDKMAGLGFPNGEGIHEQILVYSAEEPPLASVYGRPDIVWQPEHHVPASRQMVCVDSGPSASQYSSIGRIDTWSTIKNIVEVGQEEYYDFHVPVFENYWCGGVFHHNCGKTTLARILAVALGVAPGHKELPQSMDFKETNCASSRGIDDIRDMDRAAKLSPANGKARVFLLDECQQLTTQAQSALLKVLEDVADTTYFFLCSSIPEKMSKAIRSRCTPITVKPLSAKDMKELIIHVCGRAKVEAPASTVVDKIVEVADGCAREAVKLLNKVHAVEGAEAQLLQIDADKAHSTGKAIAAALLKASGLKSWPEIAKLILSCEEDWNQVRLGILGYATAVVLNGGSGRAAFMLNAFMDPFYEMPRSQITRAAYEVCTSK